MNKISIAIATYNEEDIIEKCLKSVYSWAHEIILVDGSSTDDTVKIAKKYGAKVITTGNPVMFHINKQKAIDACTGDWILQLDADEEIPKELKEEILKAIEINPQPTTHNSQRLNGYWIPRKNYFLNRFLKKGGQYPDYTLRLYRKGKGKLPCKSVHEQAEVMGETARLHQPMHHYSYPNFAHYLDHFNRYTSIVAEELKQADVSLGIGGIFTYYVLKPLYWFILTYFRHKGFQDGFAGFVFSFFSSLRYPVAYTKYWESKK